MVQNPEPANSALSTNKVPHLSRSSLDLTQIEIIRLRRHTKPALNLVRWKGRAALLKDYKNTAPLYRQTIGFILRAREAKVLEQLQGLAGMTQILARIDLDAILVDYVEGEAVGPWNRRGNAIPAGFFEKAKELVLTMHRRGVLHLDLSSRRNIIITHDLQPHIVDFNSAITRNELNRWAGWTWEFLTGMDHTGLLRLKAKLARDQMTDTEWKTLQVTGTWHRLWPFRRASRGLKKLLRPSRNATRN